MDILELFPFMRRAAEPQTPADTLPVITQRLNGGRGDPAHISQALEDLLEAQSGWSAYKDDQELHLRKLVAEGAAEKARRPIRDAISRASEEINLLEEGEAPLRQLLVKAKAEVIRSRKYRDQNLLAAASTEIIEALIPLAARANELVKRVERGELDIDPGVGMMVLPLLKFWADWIAERRSDFAAAVATLKRQPVHRLQHPESFPAGRPKSTRPEPQPGPQHAVRTGHPDTVGAGVVVPPRPRAPDDLSPLEPGEVRVRVMRAGYETPNGKQCDAGQVVKLPADVAQKAMANKAVETVEMNVDRTHVEGSNFQTIDPRTPLTTVGSGGDSLVRINVAPHKAAAAAEHPNEGAAK